MTSSSKNIPVVLSDEGRPKCLNCRTLHFKQNSRSLPIDNRQNNRQEEMV